MTQRLLVHGRGLVMALGLALVAGPVAGQRPDDLARVLDHLTALWEAGDAGGLADLSAGAGLDLEVQGHALGPLSGRRAAAALRHLFAAQQTVSVRSPLPSRVAGAADRAFVELTWIVRPAGAPVSERTTVFIGFVREGTSWKVSQIRVFP